ncbi:Saccharopine dehydrogenase-domain-containing protein [Mycena belliarum]|uniref:Saccharopine dehydrogenase-domain-containing protein n=1 Tax=Mycena belliarum TaxID=1033014 RepID=A0AAD6UG51_9AGAR|nr:Saccharopine dehydrogenase-domain-containing protein [Mycena belliae]
MSAKSVVLLLGATGFTGRLIAKYLYTHPDSASFTLALGARSKDRLDAVVSDLGLGSDVQLHVVDVGRPEQIRAAVSSATVVINTVGPFWSWGTSIVEACVSHGVHYVDLTGETEYIKRIVTRSHYAATKTGAIIVPSCGFDSVPADITAYLSSKTLRDAAGGPVDIDTSVSAYVVKGGFSGGTIATVVQAIEKIPADERRIARIDYSLSPARGIPSPRSPLVYRMFLPDTGKTLVGGFWFMRNTNRSLVQRTWGLLETAAALDTAQVHYGPAFKYDEFIVTAGPVRAVLMTLGLAIGLGAFLITPIRWLLKKLLPQSGEGPTEAAQKAGFMKVTNLTTSVASPARPAPIQVKTVMTGTGDPGYSLTAVLISEAALSLVLAAPGALPPLARGGGVLTPATAMGDVLVERLVATGRVTVESKVVVARPLEGKKTV